tara:strand:- start:1811 stop:2116 length:306 start_codon:yes stop_codon:yes gene_type:complete
MKLDVIIEKLLKTAKNDPPSDRVPYAFEKRIMAHIAEQPEPDSWLAVGRMLWRAVVPYSAVAAFAAVAWLSVSPAQNNHPASATTSEVEEIAALVIELPAE